MTATWSLADFAMALNGSANGDWINVRGPGHGPDDRSLGFRLDANAPDGIRVHSLAGDDLGECRRFLNTLLQNAALGRSASLEFAPSGHSERALTARIATALGIWDASTQLSSSVAENYLATRGCALTSSVIARDVLRFRSHCPFGRLHVPAMVALMRDVISGEPTGIHRTALLDDGSGKRVMPGGTNSKAMMGKSKGAAVMLAPVAPVMGIAEGIETAMSAAKLFGIPVWAALSSASLANLPLMAGLDGLVIMADHDRAGLDAAKFCAARYAAASIDSEIRYPRQPNTDWNDYLGGDYGHEENE